MANESAIVTVTLNLAGGGLTAEGFGTDLILSNTGNAWATPEIYRVYTSAASVLTDFPATTPEYGAAVALFAQPYKPAYIVIGKGTYKPTMARTISISSVATSTAYKVNVYDNGALWSTTYTSGVADANDDIVAGLVALLTPSAWQTGHIYSVGQRCTNTLAWVSLATYVAGDMVSKGGYLYICTVGGVAGSTGPSGTSTTTPLTDGAVTWYYTTLGKRIYEVTVAGTSAVSIGPSGTTSSITDNTVTWKYIATPNFTTAATGSAGSKIVTFTGNAAGQWFAVEPIASGDPAAVSNLMALTDTTADPGVSTDLATVNGAYAQWYALTLLFKSSAILTTATTGVNAWCSANGKLLVPAISDTACATASYSGATDVGHALTVLGSSYTAPIWHPRDYEFADAAKCGYFLPIAPGSDNWCRKTYIGVTPVTLTPTQQTNLAARRMGFIYTLGNQNVDGGLGYVEDAALFMFIDTRRNLDYWTVEAQDALINLVLGDNKVPHTDAGLALIQAALQAVNKQGITSGIISPDVTPTVTVPKSTDAGTFNANTRALSGIVVNFKLANAIDSMTVVANVTQ